MITRTRWQVLVAVALAVGALGYVGTEWWVGRGNAPVPIPPTVAAVLLLVAGVLFVLGRSVRRFVQGRRAPMDPLRAFRILVLAKASALAGAALAGFYTGTALVVAGLSDAPEARTQTWSAAAAALAGVVLVVVALVVEWFCRVPPEDSDPTREGPHEPA